jgi:SAM-dependent methyltransferase
MRDIQRRTAETCQLAPERGDVKRIRDKAIALHDETADYFYSEYQKMRKYYFASSFAYGRKKLEVLLDETLQDLPKGSSVLDIGCGTGEQLKRCRQLGFNVTGIEPSPEMRTIARRLNPGVSIQYGIITSLPFQDESFDFVLVIEVLRYLHRTDIQQAYREMLRVLKPGGRLFLTVANRYALDGFYIYDTFKRFFFRLVHYEEPVHCEFVSPKQIRHDLDNLGVKEIVFHGRMFAPLRLAYKINATWGARIARSLESFDDSLSRKKWTVPLAGHLIVIAIRAATDSLQKED